MAQATLEIQSVSEDVARLRRERPHARAFVDPFMGLLLARPGLVDGLEASARQVPDTPPDVSRLGLGGCLEPRDALPLDEAGLRRVFDALHQLLIDGFPSARGDLMHIGMLAVRKQGFLLQVIRDMLGDRGKFVSRAAHALGVEPKTLSFWCVQMLTPITMARGRELGPYVDLSVWNRGYCPVCGAWPGYARLREDGRELTCSSCGFIWRYAQPACPYCDTGGARSQILALPGFETERVVVCRRCNHYLPEIVAEPFPGMSPEVEALVLAPLELLAPAAGPRPGQHGLAADVLGVTPFPDLPGRGEDKAEFFSYTFATKSVRPRPRAASGRSPASSTQPEEPHAPAQNRHAHLR